MPVAGSKDVQGLQKQLADVKAAQAAWEKQRDKAETEMKGEAMTEAQYQEWKQLKQTAPGASPFHSCRE